ncbi:MAG: hypothetical protein HY518_03435 [Candidatus Aenigmarchaeota archaeon]|nr:hypothetical protein [Candidatus Aenigmarchaeota archaeon]
MENLKAQTTMVLVILVIIIFTGLAVFLLSLSSTFNQDEYLNLYASNLLLAVLRADTGYSDADCRQVADLVACAYFVPTHRCDLTGPACGDIANATIAGHMERFDLIRKNFDYLFVVEPKDFISQTQIKIGNPDLDCDISDKGCASRQRFVVEEKIQKTAGRSVPFILNVRLILARRSSASRPPRQLV